MKLKIDVCRVAPTDKTELLALGWTAISHRYFEDKQSRRKAYGEVYKIKSKRGTIYRNLRFSPKLKGSPKQKEAQLLIDWQGWIDLCEIGKESEAVEVSIKKANPFEVFYHTMSHPDPAVRHSVAIARVGLYISIISLILAFK